MIFLLGLLLSFSANAQDLAHDREHINRLLRELEVRSKVQTVLLTEHERANLVESRRLFLEIAHATAAGIPVKTGVHRQIINGVSEIPHEVKVVGRELGPGVMYLYIGVEVFDWLGPVFFTAIGQPAIASVIIAVPETAVLIPIVIAAREVAYRKKENRVYGGRKNRRELVSKRNEEWMKEGVSSLEKDRILAGFVIAEKNHRSNPDALNFRRVKKYLRKNGYWNHQISRIAKDAKWSKTDKSILLLSQLSVGQQFDPSTSVPDTEIERWAIETTEIRHFSQIKEQLDKMPTKDVKASTLYRFWEI